MALFVDELIVFKREVILQALTDIGPYSVSLHCLHLPLKQMPALNSLVLLQGAIRIVDFILSLEVVSVLRLQLKDQGFFFAWLRVQDVGAKTSPTLRMYRLLAVLLILGCWEQRCGHFEVLLVEVVRLTVDCLITFLL